jgi:hypothetical protein
MRIEDLRSETNGDRARIAATVIWEDCDRDPQEVFCETTRDFAADLTCDPHAFLIGAILPAIKRGEQRIAIDAPICPDLRNGTMIALEWLREWSLLDHSIRIEVGTQVRYPQARQPRAASFLSGGVDSLAILRANRLHFPLDHPGAFKDCLFVHGFDIGGLNRSGLELAAYEMALNAASTMAQDAGVTLIPVYTNVRHLYDDVPFWIYQFHPAALASVAHAFSQRLTAVSVASSFCLSNLALGATHPLIEPNYSSMNLRIRHEGILYSRLDKVRLLSDWQVALENLRVCTQNPPGMLNCGKCEKCLRTMLELLALNSLEKATAFPSQDVSPEMLAHIRLSHSYEDMWYAELIPFLTAQGRHDLIEVIQEKRVALQKRLAWQEERDWKGAVKRLDRKWLGGILHKTYGIMRNSTLSLTASCGQT